jgi:putative transposase
VRYWCRKFGQAYANQIRRRRPELGVKWHLDEVFLTIHGKHHYFWRAVDQDGHVLDILVHRRRDQKAAKTFLRMLLKGLTYLPRVLITDKLKSYGAGKQEILTGVEHRRHRYLKNRMENSHQPTRQRERRMQQFNHRGTLSDSSPPMVASPSTSDLDATDCLPASTAKGWGNDSRSGGKSRGQQKPHKGKVSCPPPLPCLLMALG